MNTEIKNSALSALSCRANYKAYIEAYIIYSGIIKNKSKLKFGDFLDSHSHVFEQFIDQDFFFLNRERALKQVTYLSDTQGMLKAYLPESAIAGYADHLILKPEALRLENIHGYYPGWAKGQIYYKNPSFDSHILRCVKTIALEEF